MGRLSWVRGFILRIPFRMQARPIQGNGSRRRRDMLVRHLKSSTAAGGSFGSIGWKALLDFLFFFPSSPPPSSSSPFFPFFFSARFRITALSYSSVQPFGFCLSFSLSLSLWLSLSLALSLTVCLSLCFYLFSFSVLRFFISPLPRVLIRVEIFDFRRFFNEWTLFREYTVSEVISWRFFFSTLFNEDFRWRGATFLTLVYAFLYP